MAKGEISNKKKLAMGKSAKVALKAGGKVAAKGKEVKVKHVVMKKGGKVC